MSLMMRPCAGNSLILRLNRVPGLGSHKTAFHGPVKYTPCRLWTERWRGVPDSKETVPPCLYVNDDSFRNYRHVVTIFLLVDSLQVLG